MSTTAKPYAEMTAAEKVSLREEINEALREQLRKMRENPTPEFLRAKHAQDEHLRREQEAYLARGYNNI